MEGKSRVRVGVPWQTCRVHCPPTRAHDCHCDDHQCGHDPQILVVGPVNVSQGSPSCFTRLVLHTFLGVQQVASSKQQAGRPHVAPMSVSRVRPSEQSPNLVGGYPCVIPSNGDLLGPQTPCWLLSAVTFTAQNGPIRPQA